MEISTIGNMIFAEPKKVAVIFYRQSTLTGPLPGENTSSIASYYYADACLSLDFTSGASISEHTTELGTSISDNVNIDNETVNLRLFFSDTSFEIGDLHGIELLEDVEMEALTGKTIQRLSVIQYKAIKDDLFNKDFLVVVSDALSVSTPFMRCTSLRWAKTSESSGGVEIDISLKEVKLAKMELTDVTITNNDDSGSMAGIKKQTAPTDQKPIEFDGEEVRERSAAAKLSDAISKQ